MNYTDFQRRLLIDPRAPELAEAARSRVGDDASARLAEALAFENRIDAALAVRFPSEPGRTDPGRHSHGRRCTAGEFAKALVAAGTGRVLAALLR